MPLWNPTLILRDADGQTIWIKTLEELEAWNWYYGWKPPTIEGFIPNDGSPRGCWCRVKNEWIRVVHES